MSSNSPTVNVSGANTKYRSRYYLIVAVQNGLLLTTTTITLMLNDKWHNSTPIFSSNEPVS